MDIKTRMDFIIRQFDRGLRTAGCSENGIEQTVDLIKQKKIDAISFYASHEGFKVFELLIEIDWNEYNKQNASNNFNVESINGLQKTGETTQVKTYLNTLIRKVKERKLNLSYCIFFNDNFRIKNARECHLLKIQLGFKDSSFGWLNDLGRDESRFIPKMQELKIRIRDIKASDVQDTKHIESKKALYLKCKNVAEKLVPSREGVVGDYSLNMNVFPAEISLTSQGEKKAAELLDVTSLNGSANAELRQAMILSLGNLSDEVFPSLLKSVIDFFATQAEKKQERDLNELYLKCEEVAEKLSLSNGDYSVKTKSSSLEVSLTFQGQKKLAELFDIKSIKEPVYAGLEQRVISALIKKEKIRLKAEDDKRKKQAEEQKRLKKEKELKIEIKNVNKSLILNLATIVVLIFILLFSKFAVSVILWKVCTIVLPIAAWLVYVFVSSIPFDDKYSKYNKAIGIILSIVGLTLVSNLIFSGSNSGASFFSTLSTAIYNLYSVPLFALIAISSLKELNEKNDKLTEKKNKVKHIPLLEKISIILCSVLAVFLLAGIVKPFFEVQISTEAGGGWGDTDGGRPSYTIEQINSGVLGDTITFNSISDSKIGDEKNFVGAKSSDSDSDVWNANSIDVEDGKTYTIRLYVHNNNPKGYDAVANDVRVSFSLPTETSKSQTITGYLNSSNAQPTLYWDGVTLTSDQPFYVAYINDSAKIYNTKFDGKILNDDIITSGVAIGYDSLNGIMPGCYEYDCVITIDVIVHEQK